MESRVAQTAPSAGIEEIEHAGRALVALAEHGVNAWVRSQLYLLSYRDRGVLTALTVGVPARRADRCSEDVFAVYAVSARICQRTVDAVYRKGGNFTLDLC